MVEDEDDISELDIAELQKLSGESATQEVKEATPELEKPVEKVKEPVDSSDYAAKLQAELDSGIHVSPAAAWHLSKNHLLPSDVKPTGPRGYITKGDVLASVEAEGPGPRKQATASPKKEKKAKKAKPAKKPAAAPKVDASQQNWTDIPVDSE